MGPSLFPQSGPMTQSPSCFPLWSAVFDSKSGFVQSEVLAVPACDGKATGMFYLDYVMDNPKINMWKLNNFMVDEHSSLFKLNVPITVSRFLVYWHVHT